MFQKCDHESELLEGFGKRVVVTGGKRHRVQVLEMVGHPIHLLWNTRDKTYVVFIETDFLEVPSELKLILIHSQSTGESGRFQFKYGYDEISKNWVVPGGTVHSLQSFCEDRSKFLYSKESESMSVGQRTRPNLKVEFDRSTRLLRLEFMLNGTGFRREGVRRPKGVRDLVEFRVFVEEVPNLGERRFSRPRPRLRLVSKFRILLKVKTGHGSEKKAFEVASMVLHPRNPRVPEFPPVPQFDSGFSQVVPFSLFDNDKRPEEETEELEVDPGDGSHAVCGGIAVPVVVDLPPYVQPIADAGGLDDSSSSSIQRRLRVSEYPIDEEDEQETEEDAYYVRRTPFHPVQSMTLSTPPPMMVRPRSRRQMTSLSSSTVGFMRTRPGDSATQTASQRSPFVPYSPIQPRTFEQDRALARAVEGASSSDGDSSFFFVSGRRTFSQAFPEIESSDLCPRPTVRAKRRKTCHYVDSDYVLPEWGKWAW